jgi:lysozyme family protein
MYESNWEYALDNLLAHEGGYTNHERDRGGATIYGISLRYLKAAGLDFNFDGEIDIRDIQAMNRDDAAEIYKRDWWDKYKYNLMRDDEIAAKALDLSVNMGPKQAHKILQASTNKIRNINIEVDGIIGPETLSTINLIIDSGDSDLYLQEVRSSAEHYYINLAADNPELRVFLKGWINRAWD